MASAPPVARYGTVRQLRSLAITAALVPLLLLGALAWYDYVRTLGQARAALAQTTRIVHEHAAMVLQSNPPLLERVLVLELEPPVSSRGNAATSLALWQDYFAGFYGEVAGPDTDLAISIFTSHGDIVSRHPGLGDGPARYDAAGTLMKAIAGGATEGIVQGRMRAGGLYRIAAFRQVAPYPVYVSVGHTRAFVLAEWRHDLVTLGAIVLPAWLALMLTTCLALRNARSEHAALVKWHEEAARRTTAEDQLRQFQKYEALAELTGGLAHDFNNVLNIVSTNVEILALLPRGADLHAHLAAMKRAVASGTSLTRHLLAFARKQPLDFDRVSVREALPRICDLAGHSLPKTVRLACEVSPDVPEIIADVTELELAIINLAINARDAMPDGGTITVNARRQRIDPGGLPLEPGEYVAISVADTGTGIPEALLHRVFEPFFTTKMGKGTGLGLSRVHGYATQLGGTVIAQNVPGSGAEITLYVPAAKSPTETDRVLDIHVTETRAAAGAGAATRAEPHSTTQRG